MCFALFAWFAWAVLLARMQQVQNIWLVGTGLYLSAQTQMQFSKQPLS